MAAYPNSGDHLHPDHISPIGDTDWNSGSDHHPVPFFDQPFVFQHGDHLLNMYQQISVFLDQKGNGSTHQVQQACPLQT